MRRVEVHVERAQKIGVRSRVDPAGNVAGNHAFLPGAPPICRLHQRLAQSPHAFVDVPLILADRLDAGRDLNGPGVDA